MYRSGRGSRKTNLTIIEMLMKIRRLSDSWTGFTKFTLLKETPAKGEICSGGRLTKIQTTTRPDRFGPEAWSRIGKAAQKKEKQKWAIEEPKLENARNL